MRIALVSQEYPPETAKGGIGTQTFAKARGLALLAHDVTVISRSANAAPSDGLHGGVRVIRVGGFEKRMPLHSEVVDQITYSAAIAECVTREHLARPFDLVDFPEWGAEGYVTLLNRSPWFRIPTVVHLHGPLVMFAHRLGWPELDSEFYRTGVHLEGTAVRLADAIVSSSRCSLEWCARHYGIPSEGVPIIHTGIDTTRFAPRDVPKAERPTIVFAGKLARNKGVPDLVRAALGLVDEFPDLQLRLLGRGDPDVLGEARALAASAGRPDLLETPGFVAHEDLPGHFSRAHVFAAPSHYEGGPGFVYLEAMACELPTIACSGSGAAEVVIDGETGLLVPPGDEAALTHALRRLLGDAGLRDRMGRAARAHTLEHASTPACIQRLESFYLEVIRRGAGRAGP